MHPEHIDNFACLCYSFSNMRICLIPLTTKIRNPAANLEHLKARLTEACLERPNLVCLPECTSTGYLYQEEDLRCYAEAIPGPTTAQMADLAGTFGIYLCFGLIEQAETGILDSAVLLDRAGRVLLIHRKIEEKQPFAQGSTVGHADTELGRLGILICGDLFNTEVVDRLDRSLDLLLVPMSRSFDGVSPDPERWIRVERQAYLNAVRAAGVPALLVNSLEADSSEPAFGGGLVVSAGGELLAESPHGTEQILTARLESRKVPD